MTEERIITAATITSGEKTDGKELPKLVQKSKSAGMQIDTVIGDKAYSDKKNIDAAKALNWQGIVYKSEEQAKNDLYKILNV